MESIISLLPSLMKGVGVTLQITFFGAILTFIIAFVVGFGRLSNSRILRAVTGMYVEVIRGTSLLIQLFWIFFVLPFFGLRLSPMAAGVLALGINYGAYGSEIVRSAILAVPKGQTEASIALNMSPGLRMRRIILPQAILTMLPSFGNSLIELLKSTALVSLITLSDLTFQGVLLNTTTLQTTRIFSLLLVIYFLLAYPLTLSVRALERKLSVGRL